MRVLSLEEMELVSGAGKKRHKPTSGGGSSSKASSSKNCATGGSSSGKGRPCKPPPVED